jgi:hypothetical protein
MRGLLIGGIRYDPPRPAIDDQYIGPIGEVLTVRATWEHGVVFDQERIATLVELDQGYRLLTAGTDKPILLT